MQQLFIKIKGFGYQLFTNYKYLLFPKIELEHIDVEYLSYSVSNIYFDSIDLHFFDGLSTTFAQSMAYNIPSVCFWNKELFLIKPDYQSLVNKLIDVGIIVTNPEEVYTSMKRLYNDPAWWYGNEVQKVRNEFIFLFAFYNENWQYKIQSTLLAIIENRKNDVNTQSRKELLSK